MGRKFLRPALVLVGLAGVGLAAAAYLRPDWVSSAARKLGVDGKGRVDYGLFCQEHKVPEKFCTLCHSELKKTLLLCAEHGDIPEEICTLCHPEVQAKYDIGTCEHRLPEFYCPTCHPENANDGSAGPLEGAGVDDGYCKMLAERGLKRGPEVCERLPLVRLASAELAETVGIRTTRVVEELHAHELEANAETAYDANRYAEIFPRVRGYLREVRADLGKPVAAGDVLAVVDSVEVSTAKTQYLAANSALRLANDTYRRISSLLETNSIALKEEVAARSAVDQAKANRLDAEQRLRNFLFDDADLAHLLESEDTRPLLDIVSPIAGSVIARHAVQGEAVEAITNVFTIANTGSLWLWLDIYERDVTRVREGQPVWFEVSGLSDDEEPQSHEGKVTWVSAEVNGVTRTTKVRAELFNSDGKLRPNQYGRGRIRVEEPHKALTLARSAVQRHDGCDLVFLPQGNAIYRPQRIRSRATDDRDVVEVLWGLEAGQEVVTDGSFLLKTEILKGSIGAGCCD